tara:strand:+ start:477 stop:1145 length:669 start_codon:yes stop_codon:yes gene_type:complete
MKQGILNFKFKFKDKDFFISKKNILAMDLINQWPKWSNQIIFVYGPKKCGKTSIARIWQERSRAIFLSRKRFDEIISSNFDVELITKNNWVIDDINSLFKKEMIDEKVLNLINILLSRKTSNLLITCDVPPRLVKTKINDLISRISSAFVVEVKEPDNNLLCKIIKKYLSDRNISISNHNLEYLSKRIERSYESAIDIAKKIDKKSLQTHSKITTTFLSKII